MDGWMDLTELVLDPSLEALRFCVLDTTMSCREKYSSQSPTAESTFWENLMIVVYAGWSAKLSMNDSNLGYQVAFTAYVQKEMSAKKY